MGLIVNTYILWDLKYTHLVFNLCTLPYSPLEQAHQTDGIGQSQTHKTTIQTWNEPSFIKIIIVKSTHLLPVKRVVPHSPTRCERRYLKFTLTFLHGQQLGVILVAYVLFFHFMHEQVAIEYSTFYESKHQTSISPIKMALKVTIKCWFTLCQSPSCVYKCFNSLLFAYSPLRLASIIG